MDWQAQAGEAIKVLNQENAAALMQVGCVPVHRTTSRARGCLHVCTREGLYHLHLQQHECMRAHSWSTLCKFCTTFALRYECQAEAKLLASQKHTSSVEMDLRDASAKYEQAAQDAEEMKRTVGELKQAAKEQEERAKKSTDVIAQLQTQLSRGKDDLCSVQGALVECKKQLAESERELEAARQVDSRRLCCDCVYIDRMMKSCDPIADS